MKQQKKGIEEELKNPELLRRLKAEKIQMVKCGEDNYPKRLEAFDNKPQVLFYKGRLPEERIPTVAMIGARACSNYGRKYAKEIARELSDAGVQVISGMARGIDTYSQLGALEGKTPTFSVLGSGVDVCYPVENMELYHDIINSGGGIISEYLPGTAPLAWHFPLRNRIISLFSDIVVLIEAKQKSGSLITVEWALEQGKDVMVLPGRVGDVLSEGCNRLMKSGAGIVTSAQDILDVLQIEGRKTESDTIPLPEELKKIYALVEDVPKSLEEIIEQARESYEVVIGKLLQLQLLGLVEQPTEYYYAKK